MAITLTSSGAVAIKAGKNFSTDFLDNDIKFNQIINMAEAEVTRNSRRDWVALFSGLSTNVKEILDDVVSSKAAMWVINYDMGNYNSRIEAETMLDVLRDSVSAGLAQLKDDKFKDFVERT